MLEIRKPKDVWIVELAVCLIVTVTSIAVYVYLDAGLIFVVAWSVLFGGLVIRCQIAAGRILQMDCQGCTISFLGIKKQYGWNELKVKRIEYCKNMRRSYLPYKLKCAVFSPEPIYEKEKRNAENYCYLFHPFSVVYIFLIPKKRLEKMGNGIYNDIGYVVEEELFIEKMKEWGVEIE